MNSRLNPRIIRARDGIPIAPALMHSLDQLADELGMARLGQDVDS